MRFLQRATYAKMGLPRGTVRYALTALALAISLGCDRAGARSDDSDGGIVLGDTPRPRALVATPDTAARVSALVFGAAGGTIGVSTDRVAYRLVVPPNAIAGSERITLTPLSAARGLPGDAPFAAGVRLEPEGLRFLEPVTLEVVPIARESFGDVRALASRGDGADLHLYPVTVGDGAVTLTLEHFSNYVLAEGGDAVTREAVKWPPRGAEAQFEQRLAALLGAERERVLAEGDEGSTPADVARGTALSAKLVAEFRDHYVRVVRPQLVAATTDDTHATEAITGYLSWRRRAYLLVGGSQEENDALFAKEQTEALALVHKAIRNAFEQAAERCEQTADFFQFNRMLGIARSAQMIGAPELVADANEQLERCTSFELAFESFISQDVEIGRVVGGSARTRVSAVVPLAFDWKTGQLSGTAPLENLESTIRNLSGFGSNCVANSTSERANGVFTVFGGSINLDRLRDSTKSKAAPNVVLYVQPGRPQVGSVTRCPGAAFATGLGDAIYPWDSFHREEDAPGDIQDLFGSTEISAITDWEAGPPGVVARKVYDRTWTDPAGRHVERTVFELRRPVVR